MHEGTCCLDLLVDVSATNIVEIFKYGGTYHASKTETTKNGFLQIVNEPLKNQSIEMINVFQDLTLFIDMP